MRRLVATTIATTIATAAIVAIAAAPAHAAKGGGGKPAPAPDASSSVAVKNVDVADTVINFGDTVTFDVKTTATDTPAVQLDCYQNGSLVLTSAAGFYPWWPWSTDFKLTSGLWTGGSADCTARLYKTSSNGLRTYTLATQSFHVAA
jgi:hypothetical protein